MLPVIVGIVLAMIVAAIIVSLRIDARQRRERHDAWLEAERARLDAIGGALDSTRACIACQRKQVHINEIEGAPAGSIQVAAHCEACGHSWYDPERRYYERATRPPTQRERRSGG